MVMVKQLCRVGGSVAAAVVFTACGPSPDAPITPVSPASHVAAAPIRVLAEESGTSESRVSYWQQRLAGKKLTRIGRYGSGGGGYTYRRDSFLCSDGTYTEQSESSVYIDTGGASAHSGGQKQGHGTWQVIEQNGTPKLEARKGDEDVVQLTLTERGGKTFMNGVRVFVTPQDACP